MASPDKSQVFQPIRPSRQPGPDDSLTPCWNRQGIPANHPANVFAVLPATSHMDPTAICLDTLPLLFFCRQRCLNQSVLKQLLPAVRDVIHTEQCLVGTQAAVSNGYNPLLLYGDHLYMKINGHPV